MVNTLGKELNLRLKQIRAKEIIQFCKKSMIYNIVCFSCGNSSKAILELWEGDEVLQETFSFVDISPQGSYKANHWVDLPTIHKTFGYSFLASSGALPVELMNTIADTCRTDKIVLSLLQEYRDTHKNTEYDFPSGVSPINGDGLPFPIRTGSGETIICLAMAFPKWSFSAVYNIDKYTKREDFAPLNSLVSRIATNVII